MLQSAVEHYRRQRVIAEMAVIAAARTHTVAQLTSTVAAYQAAAVEEADDAVALMLAEQGLEALAAGAVRTGAIAGVASSGQSLRDLMSLARTAAQQAMFVLTQVLDAGRVGGGVALASRPEVTGYIRNVGPTCCARCAILAGRFYRWSDGFLRHPQCKCVNVPVQDAEEIETPADLFAQGRVTGLSKADAQAIRDGANIGRVVNVRSTKAGLHTAGGAVLTRNGRPTPEQIYRVAATREQAIQLLRAADYIT